jgi:hypothetical protein
LKGNKMNITLKDLNIIVDTMLGSVKVGDRLGAFKYSSMQREEVGKKLLDEMTLVELEFTPNEP